MTELERPLDPVAALLGRATELGPEERDAARERFLQRAERELGDRGQGHDPDAVRQERALRGVGRDRGPVLTGDGHPERDPPHRLGDHHQGEEAGAEQREGLARGRDPGPVGAVELAGDSHHGAPGRRGAE